MRRSLSAICLLTIFEFPSASTTQCSIHQQQLPILCTLKLLNKRISLLHTIWASHIANNHKSCRMYMRSFLIRLDPSFWNKFGSKGKALLLNWNHQRDPSTLACQNDATLYSEPEARGHPSSCVNVLNYATASHVLHVCCHLSCIKHLNVILMYRKY